MIALTRFGLLLALLWASAALSALALGRGLPAERIAFLAERQGVLRAYVIDIERRLSAPLNRLAVARCCFAPAPGGVQVAVQISDGGDLAYYRIDGQTGTATLLQELYGIGRWLAWSADGRRAAYAAALDFSDDPEIWLISFPDGTRRQLTDNRVADYTPNWSPDGTQIAYISEASTGQYDIFVMDADGGNVRRLTRDSTLDSAPTWSPDGTRLAFMSGFPSGSDIFVMNADGGNVRRLTRGRTGGVSPSWSPDGTRMAFVSRREGQVDIYLMDSDGKNVRRLTTDRTVEAFPLWLR